MMIEPTSGLRFIADYLRDNDGFVLIMHMSPDGDTIGSALALYLALKGAGKRVLAVCQDKLPHSYDYLPCFDECITPDCAVGEKNVIAIDCGDEKRLGTAYPLFEKAETTFCIDHHGTNPLYAKYNEVRPNCAATAEIVHAIITLAFNNITPAIADCLYTGIMTDTGNFSYNNVTANTFEIAAELIRAGVLPNKINTLVYRTVRLAKTRLLGRALTLTQLAHDGKIGYSVITQADMIAYGASADDAEGIVEHIRDIETVEVALFIRECKDGSWKVNLRSKDLIDVSSIAKSYGGGGHIHAAGFNTSADPNEFIDDLLYLANEMLEACHI